MKTRTQIQQSAQPSPRIDPSFIGPPDAANQPKQRRFACSVSSYNTDHTARRDGKADIAQPPEALGRLQLSKAAQQYLMKRPRPVYMIATETLAQVLHNDGVCHL
jgi:hypothetical protein